MHAEVGAEKSEHQMIVYIQAIKVLFVTFQNNAWISLQ